MSDDLTMLNAHRTWNVEADDLRAENYRLRVYAKRATAALREVRPLGGSELFMRVGEEFYADPEYCAEAIRQMRDELHQYRRDEALARK